jgi:hypothetical protein
MPLMPVELVIGNNIYKFFSLNAYISQLRLLLISNAIGFFRCKNSAKPLNGLQSSKFKSINVL